MVGITMRRGALNALTCRDVAERRKYISFVGTTAGNFEQQEKRDTCRIEFSEVAVSRLFADFPTIRRDQVSASLNIE
jgi:hypothetical protein